MNLNEHYRQLYEESIDKILSDNYELDHSLDSDFDRRYGITLLIRPSAKVKLKVQEFINELKKVEPNQYYYKNSDIHITVMSIISCYDGFDITKIDVSRYIDLIKKCLIFKKSINIQFKGLTASSSCIMLKGFMNNNSINEIRNKLRIEFKNSDLEESIDKRYSIQMAHSTIIRFRKEFTRKDKFLEIIDYYLDFDFGTFEVKNLELVYNDWCQRKEFVKKLYEFNI